MLNGFQVTQEEKDNHIILRIYEGDFTGCEFFYDKVAFADEPNADGTIGLDYEYTITNGFVVPEDQLKTFGNLLGENLVSLLEDAVESRTAVYHGGTGGTFEE